MSKIKWPFMLRCTHEEELAKLSRMKNREIDRLEKELDAKISQCKVYGETILNLRKWEICSIDREGLAVLFNASQYQSDWRLPFATTKATMLGYCKQTLLIGPKRSLRFLNLSSLCRLFEPWANEALSKLLQLEDYDPLFLVGTWFEKAEEGSGVAIQLCHGSRLKQLGGQAKVKLIVLLPIARAGGAEMQERFSELWRSTCCNSCPAAYVETDRYLIFPLELTLEHYFAWVERTNLDGQPMTDDQRQAAEGFYNECLELAAEKWEEKHGDVMDPARNMAEDIDGA